MYWHENIFLAYIINNHFGLHVGNPMSYYTLQQMRHFDLGLTVLRSAIQALFDISQITKI
jgi:hypothetical protein